MDKEKILNDVTKLMEMKAKFNLDVNVKEVVYQKYSKGEKYETKSDKSTV